MTLKGKKIVIALLSVVLLVAVICTSLIVIAETTTTWSQIDLQAQYSYGTTFTVPSRTLTVGTTTENATASIKLPDGSTSNASSLVLDQWGVYEITYTAKVNRKAYKDVLTFKVPYGIYTFSTEGSSASYGKHPLSKTKQGLNIRLAEGDTITFTQVIDISNVTMNDILVEAFATPDTIGALDFRRLLFKFTDIEDPNNYIRISARQSSEGDNYSTTYFLAGGNGQPLVGWEASWQRLHVDNEWGEQATHSFSLDRDLWWEGRPAEADYDTMTLRFDSESYGVYTGSTAIVDLDNPLYFTELWKGFKSGKVRLSIQATDYVNQTANFCVSSVLGIDLSQTEMVDDAKPEITVDNDYDVMPKGEVGASYTIPTATAYDLYTGICNVTTTVYTNYSSSSPATVAVVDGKFLCESARQHAIEYRASDAMGNTQVVVLYVDVESDIPAPVITINGSASDATVGHIYTPLDYTVASSSGNATVQIIADINGYQVDITDDKFRPDRAGDYTIKYIATDYIGQVSEVSYNLHIEQSSTPIFIDEPAMPHAFISGSEYVLPLLTANDYRSGALVQKTASAKIEDANGTKTVVSGEKFTPTVANNGDKVKITYECEGAKLETIEIPCIIGVDKSGTRPTLKLENYLYSADNSIDITKNSDHMVITAKTSTANWIFANPLIAGNFEVQLQGISAKSRYSQMNVVMRDAFDPSIAICATLDNTGSKTNIVVNGVKVGLDGSLASGLEVRVGYDNGNITVGNAKIAISKTMDGKDFVGFPSNKLTVSIELVDATVGDQYKVISVNGHIMNDWSADRTAPRVIIMGNYGGSFGLNEVITLPTVFASDTVSPTSTVTMSVVDSAGNNITSVDGILLKDVDPSRTYDILLSNFGQYRVILSATDGTTAISFPYAINIDDSVAPTIKFSAGFAKELKVGDTIVIPKFVVEDNISAADKIVVNKYIYTPSGILVTIPAESNSLKVSQVGKYEVRIMVMDEAGNVYMSRTTINVTNA